MSMLTASDDVLLEIFKPGFRIFPKHDALTGWYKNRDSKKLVGAGGVDFGLLQEELFKEVSKLDDRDGGEWEDYKPHLVKMLRMFLLAPLNILRKSISVLLTVSIRTK